MEWLGGELQRKDKPVALITQMGLVHHVVPLPHEELVILLRELIINSHEFNHRVHPLVCTSTPLAGINLVAGASDLNSKKVATRKHWVQNHLKESSLLRFR
jgi:hypothetical protein